MNPLKTNFKIFAHRLSNVIAWAGLASFVAGAALLLVFLPARSYQQGMLEDEETADQRSGLTEEEIVAFLREAERRGDAERVK